MQLLNKLAKEVFNYSIEYFQEDKNDEKDNDNKNQDKRNIIYQSP
jgi:hypothetical protein